MQRDRITAAIITKNEEKNIRDCILSVKGWADEIVVVDGYSTDSTTQIATELGAKVISHRFEGDFSIERNIAMQNASGEWVLYLDADDRVTPDFKQKVDNIIGKDASVCIYKFKRKSFFLGHFMAYGGWYHYIPNLVNREKVKFEGALHERPVCDGKIGVIEGDIEHYPFNNITDFITRHNRYSSIEAKRIYDTEGACKFAQVRKNALSRTWKIFWKMYVKKSGHKEGMYGLIFSILFAFTNFLIWVKYWELCEGNKVKQK